MQYSPKSLNTNIKILTKQPRGETRIGKRISETSYRGRSERSLFSWAAHAEKGNGAPPLHGLMAISSLFVSLSSPRETNRTVRGREECAPPLSLSGARSPSKIVRAQLLYALQHSEEWPRFFSKKKQKKMLTGAHSTSSK